MKDALYHQALLELARQARADARLAAPQASVTLDNPLCGDRITLDLALAEGKVGGIGHKVRGCLLCQAAAAVIAARAPGETPQTLRTVAYEFADALAREPGKIDGRWPELAAFAPVRPHKSRHDCVLLPFQALTQALDEIDRARR
jgi:nitrogen fixation NifU-like protein